MSPPVMGNVALTSSSAHINLAGRQDLILDVSVIHEFHGDVMQDVGRNGNLRHRDPTSPILLDNMIGER